MCSSKCLHPSQYLSTFQYYTGTGNIQNQPHHFTGKLLILCQACSINDQIFMYYTLSKKFSFEFSLKLCNALLIFFTAQCNLKCMYFSHSACLIHQGNNHLSPTFYLQDCLNIFGSSSLPGMNTALKMSYAGYGEPLVLL